MINYIMTTRYRSIYPQSQKASYFPNDNIDFVLSLNKEKLLPGSITLEGKLFAWADSGRTTALGPTDEVYYDPLVGVHGVLRDITTEFRNQGVMENYSSYPRYVKHEAVATKAPESLGTETNNAVELMVATEAIAKGMLEGLTATDTYQPFSAKLRICVNKASGPLASAVTGDIRIRLRLAPNGEFLYGPGFVDGQTNYELRELKLRYVVIPDDGKRAPVSMEVIQVFKAAVDSNNSNVNTFVPAPCRAVSISFVSQATENNAGAENYLRMDVPPGIPPYPVLGAADTGHYGVERLYYAVNDSDSALVGFDLESREELVLNGLRVFNADPMKYSTLIRDFMDPETPDHYLIGMPFGTLIDFTQNKFACEIRSQITAQDPYNAYLYFPAMAEVA